MHAHKLALVISFLASFFTSTLAAGDEPIGPNGAPLTRWDTNYGGVQPSPKERLVGAVKKVKSALGMGSLPKNTIAHVPDGRVNNIKATTLPGGHRIEVAMDQSGTAVASRLTTEGKVGKWGPAPATVGPTKLRRSSVSYNE